MSNITFGNLPKSVQVINNNVKIENVPVNIPSYKNRKTNAKTIKGYLKARGGKFDRRLWQEPLVAELPDGKCYLFDGDHRRVLWKMAYPEAKTMPVQIVKVQSLQEISSLFVTINKTGRKALSANEVFVHEYLGEDSQEAKKLGNILQDCNLKVSLGTGEEGTCVGDVNGQEVMITGFKKAVSSCDVRSIQAASKAIQGIWKNDKSIGVELLAGLALIFKNTPIQEKHYDELIEYLTISKAVDITQKRTSTSFKQEGGNVHNHHEESVAIGLLSKFRNWTIDSKKMSKSTFGRYYSTYLNQLKAGLGS